MDEAAVSRPTGCQTMDGLALARLSRDERDRILGGTAIAFYGLSVS